MSMYLGPIHVKMYKRVQYLDRLSELLIKKLIPAEKEAIDGLYPAARQGDLEELIDSSNIHGWLEAHVIAAEQRFAHTVKRVLMQCASEDEAIASMSDIFLIQGKEQSKVFPESAFSAAKCLFETAHDLLLDGMPCDFPFRPVTDEPGRYSWLVMDDPHTVFWENEGLDPGLFYTLRDAWFDGLLTGKALVHERGADGVHSIYIP